MEKIIVRKIIRECLEEAFIDEMAYPESFNFEGFRNIKSFAGKIKYAQQHLLGKVGAGSARAVFKIDNEKVIKVALNKKGIAQNSSESEGFKQNYDIIARVFGVDQDDMWIEMELAKKITPKRLKELTGISLDELGTWLAQQRGQKTYRKNINLEENEFAEDVREFAGDYDYPVPGDFNRISSYGEVLRNGVPKVVLVDFGADKDVINTYY